MSAEPVLMYEVPVRFKDGEFELRCLTCSTYWPIDLEFWYPRRGMRKCLACLRAVDRLRFRDRYRNDMAFRAQHIARIRDEETQQREIKAFKRRVRVVRMREEEPEKYADYVARKAKSNRKYREKRKAMAA